LPVEVVYKLCMPFRDGKVSKEFEALMQAFGDDRYRTGFSEVSSLSFTFDEGIVALEEGLDISREEAFDIMKRLIRKKNLVGVYKPTSRRSEVTIGEIATIE